MEEIGKKSDIQVNTTNDTDKKAKKLVIKYLISLSISLIIALITLINVGRIQMFGKVIGSFAGVFEGLGVILFLFSLFTSILYLSIVLIYILYMHVKKEEWKDNVLFIDKKIDLVNFVLEVFAALLFIMIFIFTPCTVKGDSMNPTFLSNQNVICTNYMAGKPKIDDIIVFDARNENYDVDDVFYIKRVVATPGSKLRYDYDTYTLYINDVLVEEVGHDKMERINSSIEEELNKIIANGEGTEYEYTVPKNKYLVFGDNRDNSQDSRSFGYINKKQIFGRVTMRIFPLDKIKFY